MAAVRAVAVENIDCTGPVYGFDALVGRADGQVIAAVTIEITTAQFPAEMIVGFGESRASKALVPFLSRAGQQSAGGAIVIAHAQDLSKLVSRLRCRAIDIMYILPVRADEQGVVS